MIMADDRVVKFRCIVAEISNVRDAATPLNGNPTVLIIVYEYSLIIFINTVS